VPYGIFASGGLCLTALLPPAASVPPLDHVRVRPGAILPPDGGFFMPYGIFASGGCFALRRPAFRRLVPAKP